MSNKYKSKTVPILYIINEYIASSTVPVFNTRSCKSAVGHLRKLQAAYPDSVFGIRVVERVTEYKERDYE